MLLKRRKNTSINILSYEKEQKQNAPSFGFRHSKCVIVKISLCTTTESALNTSTGYLTLCNREVPVDLILSQRLNIKVTKHEWLGAILLFRCESNDSSVK